ncbi:MAG TPA: hypothetical protein VF765_01065 [Polyangiaceae bacterium]
MRLAVGGPQLVVRGVHVLLVMFLASACTASSSVPAGVPVAEEDGGEAGAQAAETGAPTIDAGVVPEASPMHLPEGGADGPPSVLADASVHDAAPEAAPWDASGPWTPVSFGVTTKDTGGGSDIVIAYGGYTATDADSQAWVTQMTGVRLAQLGVGHMYAVRGPMDPDYASREIGNSELAAALATQAVASTHVLVIAHSSGGFVADELFTFADAAVLAKIAYFNLDGGSWALTDALVGSMRGVYFCNAHDSVAGDSENTSSDESLHAMFSASHFFTVDADGSGCDVGAGWCLHDTLIINHPHDPTTFDLALDYTDFTGGRQVVTSYVDQAVSDGVL